MKRRIIIALLLLSASIGFGALTERAALARRAVPGPVVTNLNNGAITLASQQTFVDVPCGQQVGQGGDSNTTYRLQPCTYPFIYIAGTNVVVEGNGALIAPGDGAPTIFGGNVTLRDLRISGGPQQGGLRLASGNVTLERVVISGNTSADSLFGGGITSVENLQSLTLIDSAISDNVAPHGGGMRVRANQHSPQIIRIVRSTISNNRSGSTGGGLYVIGDSNVDGSATIEIVSSTISGNVADTYGGGVQTDGYTAVSVTDSTITANRAGFGGGGIHDNGRGFNVRRSIIAGNTPGGCFSDFLIDYGYNVVTADCVSVAPAQPTTRVVASNGALLGPLADNGGPTQTHLPLAGSPALDLIPSGSAGCTAGAIDQRGISRPQASGCDCGSVEKEVTDSTPPTITPSVVGTLGANGWYTSDVSINWSVVDDESPISAQTGCASSAVSSDTAGITFTCSATSDGGTSTQSVTIKRDATNPNVTFASRTAANGNGWNNTNVVVNWQCSDATAGVVSASVSQTLTGEGANQSATGTCADRAGNAASNTRTGINIDKTVPTLAPVVSPNPLPLNGTGTVTSNAADALSGLASASCGPLNTSSIGGKTVTCTASDRAGNSASASASYQVGYAFTGFFAPVVNAPALNSVGGGTSVSIKFGLGGNQGLNILAANFPASRPINCATLAPLGGYQPTSPSGRSGLQYDATTNRYNYTWKTEKAWAGTCRQFSLTLFDGATYSANFQFK